MVCKYLPSCCVLTRQALVSSSCYKGTNTITGAPLSGPHLNLITSQRPHLQIPSHQGVVLQYMNSGAANTHKHLVPVTGIQSTALFFLINGNIFINEIILFIFFWNMCFFSLEIGIYHKYIFISLHFLMISLHSVRVYFISLIGLLSYFCSSPFHTGYVSFISCLLWSMELLTPYTAPERSNPLHSRTLLFPHKQQLIGWSLWLLSFS